MTNSPKLKIAYSFIYDELLHKYHNKKFTKKACEKGYEYAKALSKKWSKHNNAIFRAISETSGLKWKKSEIQAYVVKHLTYPISMPLTIKIWPDYDTQIDIILHELIHNIIVQNENKFKFNSYSKENEVTRIELPVLAIQKLAMLKLFGEKRTKNAIKSYEPYPDYKQAWKIIEKDGAKAVIRKFISK